MLGDRARNVEISLDALCKFVDSYAGILQKELRKRVEHVSSAALEIKHKAENLTVHFKQNMTTCASFSITCQEARKGSRKEALYSAIEEPKNSVSVQQHADPAFGANKGSSFRTRMVVTDATDEEYQQEVLRQRQERQEAERRRAALEAAKGPDFGFEFSIDQEKRHAGAFELMAVPGAALKVDDGTKQTLALFCAHCSDFLTPTSFHNRHGGAWKQAGHASATLCSKPRSCNQHPAIDTVAS